MYAEFLVSLCDMKYDCREKIDLLFMFSLDWLAKDSHVVADNTAAQVKVTICIYRINLKCQSRYT